MKLLAVHAYSARQPWQQGARTDADLLQQSPLRESDFVFQRGAISKPSAQVGGEELRPVECYSHTVEEVRFRSLVVPPVRMDELKRISLLLLNRFCSFAQDLQIARVSEEAGSALSRDFIGNAEANQVVQGIRHRRDG